MSLNLRHISAQPANDYYAWQIEVMLDNFQSMGISDNSIDVVGAYDDKIPQSWLKLQRKFQYVRFFFYKDTREIKTYAPSVQAHILAKHWKSHPYLSKEAVFFHDCDFVYTKKMDFSPYLNDDKWYFSNCTSYLGAGYIESKGEGLLEYMCSLVGICACTVRANKDKGGGAQKLIKGVTHEYWEEVEQDAVNLYHGLLLKKDDKPEGEQYGIQVWTASMWSELWNAWKRGVQVEVPEEFNFAWATDITDKWGMVSFFHNAGVPDPNSGMFFKGDFTKRLPYDTENTFDMGRCSHRYFDMVKNTGKSTCLR
jgi:hypothetical protein